MTNDEIAQLLMEWPAGTETCVLVDNGLVDIGGISESEGWDAEEGKPRPIVLIEISST